MKLYNQSCLVPVGLMPVLHSVLIVNSVFQLGEGPSRVLRDCDCESDGHHVQIALKICNILQYLIFRQDAARDCTNSHV